MKIFVINAHWNNRGDEAAVRAMVDELVLQIPNVEIVVHFWVENRVYNFPYKNNVRYISERVKQGSAIDRIIRTVGKGDSGLLGKSNEFMKELKTSDLVIYAPGGAAIGEHLTDIELSYLSKLLIAKLYRIPYIFYAPSMGPFSNKGRNMLRKFILNNSALLCVREPLSGEYLKKLGIRKKVHVTLDSAFQNTINIDENEKKLLDYSDLNIFMNKYDKIVGITITDLMWTSKSLYGDNKKVSKNIKDTFQKFVNELDSKGYGIIFIPQLFGEQSDYKYMKSFATDNSFVMSDKYDCYFQQYIISRLYCVVGMRYHSNIFSAKMKTPFISISYQEKMKGFMEKVSLDNYCIDVTDLSCENLKNKFDFLNNNYEDYKKKLIFYNDKLRKQSHRTTDMVCDYINHNIKA